MITPGCDVCEKELDDYGALLFSPPDGVGCCEKQHICKECYRKLLAYIEEERASLFSDRVRALDS